MQYRDAVAVVSGGASGLGRAVVGRLHFEGATVVVLDLPTGAGREFADHLGKRAHFVAADVTDASEVRAAFATAAELGTLRVAVNCAGVATPGRIIGSRGLLPLDQFRRVVDINLVETFNVLSNAAAVMAGNEPVDGDRGIIVCTSSIAAYDGQIGQAAYAAGKGGVASLTFPTRRSGKAAARPRAVCGSTCPTCPGRRS
ncbi:NAD(P)-dependent dehydrogenase (short-subunit alcohol dehydrogenase family) [Streptomyces umbrinus]|uniref:NAD(P)-dependent dehydrogenase (Short-subunit alcohol dehydrogenase family) n=1 Tax=Streptomyces umbrinus TaxID=67370 RepID=A0ABU0SIM6_9ACTN|nr:NAD(P)-dependent dehydrogenase (short-subunit alcohol dehydrogenase family) [Streptomyces umbrinus]